MDRDQVKTIWNQRSPEDRADWIKSAGFTVEAAGKYRYSTWDVLPPYVQDTLVEQEA